MKRQLILLPLLLALVLTACGNSTEPSPSDGSIATYPKEEIESNSDTISSEESVSQEATAEENTVDSTEKSAFETASESGKQIENSSQEAAETTAKPTEENETTAPSPQETKPEITTSVVEESTRPTMETKPEPAPATEPPTEPEIQTETQPDTTTQPEAQTEPEPTNEPETQPEEETKPEPETEAESAQIFDINYWISFAKGYAESVGLKLNSEAIDCWDNPTTANANCIYLERDLSSRLNRYANDADITDVWIWYEDLGGGQYLIYIGYA